MNEMQGLGLIGATFKFIPDVNFDELFPKAIKNTENARIIALEEVIIEYVTALREKYGNDPFVKLELDQLFSKMRTLEDVRPIVIPMVLEDGGCIPPELQSYPARNFKGCPAPNTPAFQVEFIQVLRQIFISDNSTFLTSEYKAEVKVMLDSFLNQLVATSSKVDLPEQIEYVVTSAAGRFEAKYGMRNMKFTGNGLNVCGCDGK